MRTEARSSGTAELIARGDDVHLAIEDEVVQPACLHGKKRCHCWPGGIVARTSADIAPWLEQTRLSEIAGAFEGRTRA